ncbi:MAG: YkvA family protein [Frankia sp.]
MSVSNRVSLDKDGAKDLAREVASFLPDLVTMLRRVVADPRVPRQAKLEASGALAYLVSPRNRITNLIPVVGQLDDIAIVAFAFRRLVLGAGEPVLREHWRGSDRSFQVLLGATSALASPRGLLRKVAMVRSMAAHARQAAHARHLGGRQTGPVGPRIVEGEVVSNGHQPAASTHRFRR